MLIVKKKIEELGRLVEKAVKQFGRGTRR